MKQILCFLLILHFVVASGQSPAVLASRDWVKQEGPNILAEFSELSLAAMREISDDLAL